MAALVRTHGERRAARRAGDGGFRHEYLAFLLAGEAYAVLVANIAEILRPLPITEVPRAPANVLGVISVRGKLITVIDLRRRFHLPESPMGRKSRILIADLDKTEQIGVVVDEVQQVWRLTTEEIEPASVIGGDQAPHIQGVGRPVDSKETILVLLDLRPILENP